MLRFLSCSALLLAVAASSVTTASANRGGIDITSTSDPNRRFCDIVVRQRGGNPTQDMTGLIGHQNSYQATGGYNRTPRLCYLPGTR